MRRIILFITVVSCTAFAQISITRTDMANTFALGNITENHQDTLISSINIGSAGGGNSWDFTMLQSNIMGTVTSVDPSTTPYIGDFPGANYVNHTVTSNQDTTIELYFYLTLNDSLGFIGSGSTINQLPGFVTFIENNPSRIQAILPMTFNTNWNENYSQTVITEFNAVPIITITSDISNSAVVDAYGTMSLPNITPVLNALRLREETTITTSGVSTTYTRFTFISREGAQVSVTAVTPVPPTSGVIDITDASYNGILVSGIEEANGVPENYSLNQNYPNPFNPRTTIEFSIPKSEFVTLNIYNLFGQEVATLVSDKLAQGSYNYTWDASKFASGVYYYKILAGTYIQTRKLILMK